MQRSKIVCPVIAMLAVACASTTPSSAPDAAPSSVDATSPAFDAAVASRCTETANELSCPYETASFQALVVMRSVRYQTPLGTPPPNGWPVVFFFQGSFHSAEEAFHSTRDATFGQFQLVRTIRALLDGGYAVIAPEPLVDIAWQTNVPPYSLNWTATSDHAFLLAIIAGIGNGTLGPLDTTRLYATGISSGGYMTSRMAVSYPGVFRALAVHSASYATCGVTCLLPLNLPVDHPPTLFLHGAQDPIVPVTQMLAYRDELAQQGHVVDTVIDAAAGHEWIAPAVPAITAWFDAHP
ncbi:MAG TPA: PHB depolymerase family esterase [Kofleriaceae bacterium]|nr:PHB depolymerase family esterase [Kofleriaceae bacterium]